MSEDLEGLRAENKVLREELKDARARLKRALAERPARGFKEYLVWTFWLLLVLALGANLYKVLTAGSKSEPAGTIRAIPSVPVAPLPTSPPPAKPKPPSAQPAEPLQPAKPAPERRRFPGFPDVSPKNR